MLANIELLKLVYATLDSYGFHVSNGLPIDETLPYVQMGSLDFASGGTKDSFGGGYELTLHVWCDGYDDIMLHDMMDLICESLTNDSLTLENYNLSKADITLMTTLKDSLENKPINHGVIQIKFNIIN